MIYIIFSDIHSNLEALNTLIQATKNIPNSQWICLGDVVGYASHPNECIQLLRRYNIPTVIGNHDYALLHTSERRKFNQLALEAIYWQLKIIKNVHNTFIKELPFTRQFGEEFSVTHSDFSSPSNFFYVDNVYAAEKSFKAMMSPMGFFGHTHLPMIFEEEPGQNGRLCPRITMQSIQGKRMIHLKRDRRYLINPGSIGQPRDGDPRLSFVVFDSKEMVVTFQRMNYNIEHESERMIEAQLPIELAERIKVGL